MVHTEGTFNMVAMQFLLAQVFLLLTYLKAQV